MKIFKISGCMIDSRGWRPCELRLPDIRDEIQQGKK
nr:MAG TPA: PROTEIN/RNA Complex ribosomal subunit, ribonucleoprotein, ribosomal [Caudoviricetes sp.]